MNNLYIENSNDKIRQLYNMMVQKDYGEIIYHTEIAKILGFGKELSKYGVYVRKAKDMLIPHSKILKSISGVGFIVLRNEQVSGYVYRKYIKRTLNLYNYSTDILENLNRKDFEEVREQEFQDVRNLNEKLKSVTSETITKSEYYNRMDYYNSLEE